MEKITLVEAENLSKAGNILHAFLGRTGGVSPPPFGSLNVGHHVGDRGENIEKNLSIIAERLGVDRSRLVVCNQVHGNNMVHIRDSAMCGMGRYSADAIITDKRGIALCVLTADCVPIIVVDRDGRVAAIMHAGWRGTLKEVVPLTIRRLKTLYNIEPRELIAAIGPAIGGCCYRVSATLMEGFRTAFQKAPGMDNKARSIDLKTVNGWQLQKEGIKDVDMTNTCTACSVDSFFSYRKEKTTGRQLNMVMLKE